MAERPMTLAAFLARQASRTQARATIPHAPVSEDSSDEPAAHADLIAARAAVAVAGSKPRKNSVPIPMGWTVISDPRGSHKQYRCPHVAVMGTGELGRCTKTYRRNRITEAHKHLYARYEVEKDGPVPVDASLRDQLLRNLAVLCGRLNISTRAGTSEAMRDFIDNIIHITLQFAEAHPHILHSEHRIFHPVCAHSLGDYIVSAADSERTAMLERYAEKRFATLALDAGSIVHLHFVNFVVSRTDLEPLFFRSVVKETFNHRKYGNLCRKVVTQLKDSGVFVAGIVADNLPCQQLGIRNLVSTPGFMDIVVLPCANHTLNLVFTATLKTNPLLQAWSCDVKALQTILRKREMVRKLQRLCPLFPEHRWIYIFDVLKWIETNSESFMEEIVRMIEQGDTLIGSINLEAWSYGIPDWFPFLETLLRPLKRLSLQLESRKASLWMIVPLVQEAVDELKKLYIATNPEEKEMRGLIIDLTYRLVVRFRGTFNSEAACAAFALSSFGRKILRANSATGPRECPCYTLDAVFPDLRVNLANLTEKVSEEIEQNDELMIYLSDADDHGEEEAEAKSRDEEEEDDEEEEEEEEDEEEEGEIDDGNPPDRPELEKAGPDWGRPTQVGTRGNDQADHEQENDHEESEEEEDQQRQTEQRIHLKEFRRARERNELSQLLEFGTFEEAMEGPVFPLILRKAGEFLQTIAERLSLGVKIPEMLNSWLFEPHKLPVIPGTLELPPDEMWAQISTAEAWKPLAEIALRIVSLSVSEAEVERVISMQRDILGSKANRTSEKMLTARTQLRQRYSDRD
jgi:hypothetical protein